MRGLLESATREATHRSRHGPMTEFCGVLCVCVCGFMFFITNERQLPEGRGLDHCWSRVNISIDMYCGILDKNNSYEGK